MAYIAMFALRTENENIYFVKLVCCHKIRMYYVCISFHWSILYVFAHCMCTVYIMCDSFDWMKKKHYKNTGIINEYLFYCCMCLVFFVFWHEKRVKLIDFYHSNHVFTRACIWIFDNLTRKLEFKTKQSMEIKRKWNSKIDNAHIQNW